MEGPGPAGTPPIISVGMLNGGSFETASGALVAFDGAVQVGDWTFTETATPEPSSLLLLGTGPARPRPVRTSFSLVLVPSPESRLLAGASVTVGAP